MVMLYHIKEHLNANEWFSMLSMFYSSGYLGVDFFFILSGFILFYKYHSCFQTDIGKGSFKAFIFKRIARIVPLHIFVMLIFCVIPLAYLVTNREIPYPYYGADTFFLKLVLIDMWFSSDYYWPNWNTPSWTISTEFFAYLLFPFLVYLFHRLNTILKFIFPTIMLVMLMLTHYLTGSNNIGDNIGTIGLLRCISEFFFGFIICHIFFRFKNNSISHRHLGLFSLTFVVTTLLASPFVSNYIWVPILFGNILLLLVCYDTKIHRFLNLRALVFLGDISYSIYLTHIFIRNLLSLFMLENAELGNSQYILFYLFTTIIFSTLTYFFVEVRLRRYLTNVLVEKSVLKLSN